MSGVHGSRNEMSDAASRSAKNEDRPPADDSNGEERHESAGDTENIDDDGHREGILDVGHGKEIRTYN